MLVNFFFSCKVFVISFNLNLGNLSIGFNLIECFILVMVIGEVLLISNLIKRRGIFF